MLELELVQQIEKYFNRYQIRCAKEVHMGIGVPDLSINIGASKSIPLLYDYYILILIEFLINHNSILGFQVSLLCVQKKCSINPATKI